MQESEEKPCPPSPTPCSEVEDRVAQALADSVPTVDPVEASSFAPEGFIFKAPTGLPSFKFNPLTPRSANAFLTPKYVFLLFKLLLRIFKTLKSFINVILLHIRPIVEVKERIS